VSFQTQENLSPGFVMVMSKKSDIDLGIVCKGCTSMRESVYRRLTGVETLNLLDLMSCCASEVQLEEN
jgi:hypothetical protein